MNTIRNLALGLALALAGAVGADAHAKLVKSDPAADSAGKAPSSLNLSFSEEISAKLSGVVLTDAGGKTVQTSSMLNGDKTLMVMAKTPLKPGAYSVAWHAVASDDGHRTAGTYKFTVN